MCKKCKNEEPLNIGISPVEIYPIYNPDTGKTKIVTTITTMAATTDIVSDGFEPLPTSVEVDAEGVKFVRLTAKLKTNSELPKYYIPTPVSHVIETEQSILNGITGFDENTYFKLDKKLNGNLLPDANVNSGCQSIVKCKWIENSTYPAGGYWYCIVYLRCSWGHGAYEVIVK